MMLSRSLTRGIRVTIPLFAMKVSAGPPSPAEDYIEDRIDLSEYLTPHPDDSFLIRVEGESMLDAGIHPGDLLVVERSLEANNGDVVVAMIRGQFTVKRFHREYDHLWLLPANKQYPKPRQQDFSIWGVVKYVIHRL